ncbi:TPA: hypothetical protein JS297_004728 [Escherichia coli]|nr:hypothetical protein [Escherichia coli]
MAIRQGIRVDSIRFSGMRLGSLPVDRLVDIRAGRTQQKSHTETLRLDAWVLPFMNVYGVAGRTKGHSVSDVSIRTPVFTGGAFPQNLRFRLDYKGMTLGGGTTLVAGTDNWFTSLDMNYTQTRFDVLDGHINAMTLTPRVGYRFSLPETAYFPAGSLSVWVGSMYQDVQQDYRGKLSRLSLPSPGLLQWLKRVDKNGDARFCDVPAFILVNETRFLADISFARDRVIKYICTGLGFIIGRQWHQGRVSHFQSENVIQEKGYSESDGIYS